MLIYCPECNACYDVDESLLPDKGKKLRCSSCGEVFVAKKGIEIGERLVKMKNEAEAQMARQKADSAAEASFNENEAQSDIQPLEENNNPQTPKEEYDKASQDAEFAGIFSRLSKQTQSLFEEEKKLPFYKKVYRIIRDFLGLNRRANCYMALGVLLVMCFLSLYTYRFDIVRTVPFLDGVYRSLGITASIPGEGLEFDNIVWEDYEEDYVRIVEVRGFISNPTNREIYLPLLHVEMLSKDAELLQSKNEILPARSVKPEGRLPIAIKLRKPSILTKYILLTFVERN